jgi:radical SAM protein with 4Fe4S-binding SPASM domain
MTLEQLIIKYQSQHKIVDIINLDDWYSFNNIERYDWLKSKLQSVHKAVYSNNERILLTLSQGDEFKTANDSAGLILTTLQELLNQIDISNFFVVLLTNSPEQIEPALLMIEHISVDKIKITVEYFESVPLQQKRIAKNNNIGYNYNSSRPLKVDISELSDRHQSLLFDNKNFCMYPWMHLYVGPTGDSYPCCGTTYNVDLSVGNSRQQSLKEIWNSDRLKQIRLNMLNDKPSAGCSRCYEQESSGFFSMRNSANKHHGHHINIVDQTHEDGYIEQFKMVYWDVRFNNLCNLKCRSCGPGFSSSWYQDQLKLSPEYGHNHKALFFAGKFETDLWNQLIEHIDYVEQIYFAGGEPIMMDEHYKILEELEKRKKFNVRLIYNTNFTHISLKDKTVFDYWKKFDSVSVGASLDASDVRGEYIRKGTCWSEVEHNRRLMQNICPNVDFYISATLSIMNAMHLPDFHKEWTEKGFIQAKDFNVNILTDPKHYRIDIASDRYKQKIQNKYQQHLAWLSPQDSLRRASNGYESAIKFMNSTDNTHLIELFWKKTQQLDSIRNEDCLHVIPELRELL